MKKYLTSLLFLVVALGVVFLIIRGQLAAWQQTLIFFITLYFVLVTAISHWGLVRSTRERPQVFVRYYMASTTIRLLAHLVVIVSYAALNRDHSRFFIVTFMILYFIFTIFEVIYVMKKRN